MSLHQYILGDAVYIHEYVMHYMNMHEIMPLSFIGSVKAEYCIAMEWHCSIEFRLLRFQHIYVC